MNGDTASSTSQPFVTSSSFLVYYQNVRGLRTKTRDLFLELCSCDYEVIAFTETWLHPGITNSELSSNYNIYRCDRSRSTSNLERGGGVLIAVKKHHRCEIVPLVHGDGLEQIAVRFRLPSKTIYVCCIYIRPDSAPSVYEQHASCIQEICDAASNNDTILILGDYNLSRLTWRYDSDINAYLPNNASSESEISLTESVVASGLFQVLNVYNHYGRLLDLAFVNNPDNVEVYEPPLPLLPPDNHHKPFLLNLFLSTMLRDDNDSDIQFDFRSYDVDAVCRHICAVDWDSILNDRTVNDAVNVFYDRIYSIIRENVPRRNRRTNRSCNQPWWNNELRTLRNRLRKVRKRFFKHRSEENRHQLRTIEQEFSTLHRHAFREYISGLEINAKNNPASFWSFVKSQRNSNSLPYEIQYQNIQARSAEESANLFADFFKSVYNNSPTPITQMALDGVASYDLRLPLFNVTVDDVSRSFSHLDSSKGPGPDGIPPLFIKQCAGALALPASIIFNRSLSSGVFPRLWKVASITPIHKSGNLNMAQNYRGISILSTFSKVLECFVHEALYRTVRPAIPEVQHGFVKGRSTTTNLMSFVTSVKMKMQKNRQVDAIYVDFAKAFDKVPHLLTVAKLRKMGLPEWITIWLHSYLTDRLAFVKVHGCESDRFDIPSGVPQGSHLGPLLFVLFIADLSPLIQSQKLFYADDLKIYRAILTRMDCCILQRDLDNITKWCRANGMEVNAGKCKSMSFTRSRTLMHQCYLIDSHELDCVTTMKDLGIIVDSKLKFNEHISTTTAKAFSLLGFLRRITKSFHDVYAMKAVYCAVVRSVLEYAVQVWAPYSQVQCSRVERVQRSFVRYALRRLPWNDAVRLPPYENRCMLMQLETLASRRIMLQRLFCFDLLAGNIDCGELLFQLNIHAPTRRLRNHALFYLPTHRTLYGHFNPLHFCCRLFNEVSDNFDFNITKTTFKNRIRN